MFNPSYNPGPERPEHSSERVLPATEKLLPEAILTLLFPANPLETHRATRELSWAKIRLQKQSFLDSVASISNSFSGRNKEIILAAGDLALLFHFNHYRGGSSPSHYSSHLLAVAKGALRFLEEQKNSPSPIYTNTGDVLDPRAIVIAVALLHDTLEDFGKNFKQKKLLFPLTQIQQAVEYKILHSLSEVVGLKAAGQLLGFVKILSIDNPDEFPTTDYILGIQTNSYTPSIKLADIESNLESMPDFAPTYGAVMAPSQFGEFVAGTSYETTFSKQVIRCIVALADPANDLLSKLERRLKKLFRYEQADGLDRLKRYYLELKNGIREGNFADLLVSDNLNAKALLASMEHIEGVAQRAASEVNLDTPLFPI